MRWLHYHFLTGLTFDSNDDEATKKRDLCHWVPLTLQIGFDLCFVVLCVTMAQQLRHFRRRLFFVKRSGERSDVKKKKSSKAFK